MDIAASDVVTDLSVVISLVTYVVVFKEMGPMFGVAVYVVRFVVDEGAVVVSTVEGRLCGARVVEGVEAPDLYLVVVVVCAA